ncbi:MAG: hypothetical protein IKJ26_03610 [Clostridia bacterium]|nr:hypothetical protein [Clostridia bacterium]
MMYPFLTLNDETEIVHSEMREDETVKVYIEKPDAEDGFHHAICILPEYQWIENHGFTDAEIERFMEVLQSTAHLILEFSKDGGFENAASF